MIDISPKLRRLVDALRPALGLSSAEAAAQPDIELARFAARRHRVAPLLYRAWFPDPVLATGEAGEFLKRRQLRNCAAVLRQKAVAEEFREALSARGIPHAEIKGRTLGEELYGEAALRQAKDVDLLIGEGRMGDALNLAARLGYRERHGKSPLRPRRARAILKFHREVGVRHPRLPVEVELHSRLLNHPHPDWRDVPTSSSRPGHKLTIDDPDYVLYIIVHGALTGWKRLKWLCDLAMLARSVKPRVRAQVAAGAREFDCLPALQASLQAVGELWGEDLIASWLDETGLPEDHVEIVRHLTVFGRRIGEEQRPLLHRRIMRHAGIIRDPAVFGTHPPTARTAVDGALFWFLNKV